MNLRNSPFSKYDYPWCIKFIVSLFGRLTENRLHARNSTYLFVMLRMRLISVRSDICWSLHFCGTVYLHSLRRQRAAPRDVLYYLSLASLEWCKSLFWPTSLGYCRRSCLQNLCFRSLTPRCPWCQRCSQRSERLFFRLSGWSDLQRRRIDSSLWPPLLLTIFEQWFQPPQWDPRLGSWQDRDVRLTIHTLVSHLCHQWRIG